MTTEDVGRLMDERLPVLRDHIDGQLGAINAQLDAVKARQEAHSARMDALSINVTQRFDTQDKAIAEIHVETAQTNGRVRELEGWRQYVNGVKAGAGGSGHIVAATLGVLVGCAGIAIAIVNVSR